MTYRNYRINLIAAALTFIFVLACGQVRGQSVESATSIRTSIYAGGTASGFYIQYGGVKELGASGFVDIDKGTRFGLEGEGRWIEFHKSADEHVETYMGGVRYHMSFHHFQPYAKGLVGVGYLNFPFDYGHGSYLVVAPGAGVDYHLKGRWSVRAVDFEYQYWPQFTYGAMTSVGVSTGLRFRVF